MISADQNEIAKQGLEHAWNWFALHAGQRMQTFNFFLVATAFLIAGYASLLEKYHWAAFGVALLGSWLALWFYRLDTRSRQLVKAGERALAILQAQLSATAGIAELKIVERVERPEPGTSSYRRVIKVIQWTIFAVFVLGAAYAAWLDRPAAVIGAAKHQNPERWVVAGDRTCMTPSASRS
jgi:hypothetical protein